MKSFHKLAIGEPLKDFCRPERLALVVYDMQVGILRQIKEGAEVVARVRRVMEAARTNGYRVIFLRHVSLPLRLTGAFGLRQAMAWQRVDEPQKLQPWFGRGSPAAEIVPGFSPRNDEAVLDKIGFSAFEGTPLATILRDCGLTAFAICGAATEIGILPSVRHGADLGFVPVVVRDACGAGNREAGERALADIAFMGDAILTDAVTLSARMDGLDARSDRD